jgi:hypothetical protein
MKGIIDISDPTSPVKLGSVQTHSALGIAVLDDKLFVADSLGGLLIFKQTQLQLYWTDRFGSKSR